MLRSRGDGGVVDGSAASLSTALGGGGDTALGARGSGMSAAASITSPRAPRQSPWTSAVEPSSTAAAAQPSKIHRFSAALQPTLKAWPQMRQFRGFSSGGAGMAFGAAVPSAEKPVEGAREA